MTNQEQAVSVMLGQIQLQVQGQPISKVPGQLLSDILLIIAAALTLLLALMLWAKYLRNYKPKRRREGGQKVYRQPNSGDEAKEVEEEPDEESVESRRRYKYRYKRRSHRNRNPTLAETGGLPPARSEESTEPS